MLNRTPQAIRDFGVSKSQFKWLLLVNKHLSFFDLVIAINLSISANAGSPTSSRLVSVLLKGFSLADLTIFTYNIDLNTANIFIKDRLFLLLFLFFFWNFGFVTFGNNFSYRIFAIFSITSYFFDRLGCLLLFCR